MRPNKTGSLASTTFQRDHAIHTSNAMGGVLSAPNRSNIDNEDEDVWHAQHEILAAKLHYFRSVN